MKKINTGQYSVYAIKNLINSKVYIGITKNGVDRRFTRHKLFARNGSENLIHRAMRKYGVVQFFIETLFSGVSMERAQYLEINIINALNANGFGGYNILSGGGVGLYDRPETRLKKSLSAKKAWMNSEKWQSSIYSKERLRKISEASKELFLNAEYRSKFDARHSAMVKASITDEALSKKRKSFIENGNSVKVLCENGMLFDTATDAAAWAAKVTGLKPSGHANITLCARGGRPTAYGFKWSLADDD